MKKLINFSNIDTKVIGERALTLGKQIIIEGTKAVALKAAATVVTKGFDDGFSSIKTLTFDDVVVPKNNK